VILQDHRVLGPLDLRVPVGSFMGVLGPNGSGKTTLLRALTGAVKPSSGQVLLLGRPVQDYHPLEVARLVGVVPQHFHLDFGFTVAEMVAMGRYAHGGRYALRIPHAHRDRHTPVVSAVQPVPTAAPSATDDESVVAQVLQQTGLSALAERPVTRLSGGERQRALIAQTLAQETPILLLDEPLNNLDLNHQLETMQLLTQLHESGRTILVILHDLNIAAQYCEDLVLLDQGRVAAEGAAEEVLDPRVILEVFKVRVAVHRQGLRPYLTPLWSRARQAAEDKHLPKVHVIAGGGAATPLIEELVARGFAPTLGVVSVFDTDYLTAERYELDVVSAPPFQAFPAETIGHMESLVQECDVLVVAPVFFGPGNMELLRVALRAQERGHAVLFLDPDSVAERDLTGGEALALTSKARERGALTASSVKQAVEVIEQLALTWATKRPPGRG
jgi:iron complex transport system ATP-binding protein